MNIEKTEKISDSGYHVEIDRVDKDRWHELLMQFDDASIYQTWSFVGTACKKQKNLSHLILKKDGEIVGICQIVIRKIPGLRAGIANIHRGPLWRKRGNKSNLENLYQMIVALKLLQHFLHHHI